MSKNPIYACLFLILLITSFILYIYSETKKSLSTTDTNLQNYGMYTCISTISIMVFTCSIMVMFYQISCYANNKLKLFNNNDDSYDDSYDDYDYDDDYDDDE
jgi:hypothetical protein